jgi:GntR family transcriptional regulator, transcriptional repressor for pyruvate dehydrogenase complex
MTVPRVSAASRGAARRAYQSIVESVEGRLASGELRPGDRLPSERSLMVEFGVSRGTVREALRVLSNSGLLSTRHGDRSGPVLLDPAAAPLTEAVSRVARLHGCTTAELVGYRMTLEAAANQLAAHHRDDDELAAMREAIATMADAGDSDDRARFAEADFTFHAVIAKASRNSLIESSLRAVRGAILDQIGEKIAAANAGSRAHVRESIRHHRLVLTAITARDGEQAAAIARFSLATSYREYLTDAEYAALSVMCGPGPSPL